MRVSRAGADVDRLGRRRSARRRAPAPARRRRRRGTRATGSPVPHRVTSSARRRLGRLDVLADHRRDHVRVLEVEVVVRAVEVRDHRDARVESVLAPVGVGEHEQHLLRQPVGRVRLLRVAVPEVVLLERDRGELRVGADRAGGDQLRRRRARGRPRRRSGPSSGCRGRAGAGLRRLKPIPPTWAARWITTSAPSSAPRQASGSRRSCSAERTTRTSAPSSSSRPTVGLPRKPRAAGDRDAPARSRTGSGVRGHPVA